jgi:hypothetical protein
MKHTLTMIFAMMTLSLAAQTTADFENFNIGVDSFLNGSDGNGGFQNGNIFLTNSFNPAWGAWSGWGISSMTDTLTPGYLNDFSAVTGSGHNSTTYATAYVSGNSKLEIQGVAKGGLIGGFYITNTTYAYLSMRDGDGFAKKFGGLTGDDADYLLLTIKKYKDGVLGSDSIDFYLADFRFSDNSQDYIVKDWQYVNLTNLGDVDSLVFSMRSTDNSTFGMNTPAYFCMDDFTTEDFTISTTNIQRPSFRLFPNPTTDFITIEGIETVNTRYSVVDLNGRLVQNANFSTSENRIDVSHLPKGIYVISIETENGKMSKKFVKN